jgi:nitrite reductase/ring-hydroxylating ferredoxin subunit
VAAEDRVSAAAEPLARYARRVAAPLERVWENVLDWEHLPWLHREAFCGIALEEDGAWGWRARVELPPHGSVELRPRGASSALVIEVRVDRAAREYHTRTLAGAGAGTDIVTRLGTPDAQHTDVSVEFHVPGVPEPARRALGEGYVRLYTRLWDQDEAMMTRREAQHAGRAPGPARPGPRPPFALGPLAALRQRAPLLVDVGPDRFRVLEHDGRWLAHATVCPHLGGPLDEAPLEAGAVVCPWHGYRFDCETGRGPAGQRCRLAALARVAVDAAGDARLEFA